MTVDAKGQRANMLRTLAVVEHYERNSAVGRQLMQGTRYDLAVRANEVNGDGCRFPACGCSGAMCYPRSTLIFNNDGAEWDNRRKGKGA